MFDGKADTFYDSQSKTYLDENLRINGGCLRIDFGEEFDCDSVEIDFFSADAPTREVEAQKLTLTADFSVNLADWKNSGMVGMSVKKDNFVAKIIKFTAHTTYDLNGKLLTASYPIGDKIRYLRIDNPVDRIYAVRLIKNGNEITLHSPKANNLQAHYRYKRIKEALSGEFVLPEYKAGSKLTVAVNGVHGEECVYCIAEIDGKLYGFPERAPDYKANQWENMVCGSDKNNTFFLELPEGLTGKTIKIYALFTHGAKTNNIDCKAYISPKH